MSRVPAACRSSSQTPCSILLLFSFYPFLLPFSSLPFFTHFYSFLHFCFPFTPFSLVHLFYSFCLFTAFFIPFYPFYVFFTTFYTCSPFCNPLLSFFTFFFEKKNVDVATDRHARDACLRFFSFSSFFCFLFFSLFFFLLAQSK